MAQELYNRLIYGYLLQDNCFTYEELERFCIHNQLDLAMGGVSGNHYYVIGRERHSNALGDQYHPTPISELDLFYPSEINRVDDSREFIEDFFGRKLQTAKIYLVHGISS